MLPRLQHELEMRERERQLEAERRAVGCAGEVLNGLAENGVKQSNGEQQQQQQDSQEPMGTSSSTETPSSPKIGNRALNAVLTALSNYNDDDNEDSTHPNHTQGGWGIESEIEGSRSWDRPIVLHGSDGILSKHHHHHHGHTQNHASSQSEQQEEEFHSPYRVMEDLDTIDQICIQPGSHGRSAYNWIGAFYDSKQELMVHLNECWRDIVEDEESGRVEKFLLVCEFPVTLLRKVCLKISDCFVDCTLMYTIFRASWNATHVYYV